MSKVSVARCHVLAGIVALCVGSGLSLSSAPALAAAPTVVGLESFSDVGSSSVTLHAGLNAGGRPSTYRFEYGTSASYGSVTAAANVGAGQENVEVLAALSGLQPDTTYHFRVVAANEEGSAQGKDVAFATFPLADLGLPDGRGYELVSLTNNIDAEAYEPKGPENPDGGETGNSTRAFQAAADGNAMAYIGYPPKTGGEGSEGDGLGDQYLSTRAPGGGWSATDIEPPSYTFSEELTYEAFSNDLSIGVFDWTGRTLAADVPPKVNQYQNALYWRSNGDGSYHAFTTANPPHREAEMQSESEEFQSYEVFKILESGLVFAGASSNFEHLLFLANDTLTSNAVDGGYQENDLYDSVNGELHLVNVLPNGTTEPNAIFGAPAESYAKWTTADFGHVISEDGGRVFWTDLNTGDLYVRENDSRPQSPVAAGRCTVPTDACTVQVDATQGPGEGGGGRFWSASSSGSKVFFTDASRLTSVSTAAPGEPDLYEYDVENGRLTDLTVDANAGEHGHVLGVAGISEDGSYVYFVADGVLAPGVTGQTCKPVEEGVGSGGCNLYVFHEGEPVRFIATLSSADDAAQQEYLSPKGDWRPGPGNRTAEVTPDGRHLEFISRQKLTEAETYGLNDVYVYDFEADRGRHLFCASCNPSGEPPTELALQREASGFLPVSHSNTYMQRWISADGSRVFFDSPEPLVLQDTNGKWDVYEWEQDGTESCELAAGCVYLISTGSSTDNSFLLDASTSGDDVFFDTRSQLSPQDENEAFDVYDARVDAPQPLSVPACTGSGCQGVPPAPPIFATPSSVTFDGVGNFPPAGVSVKPKPKPKAKPLSRARKLSKALKACRGKRRRVQRASCEAQARKRYGSKPKVKRGDTKGSK